MVNYKSGKEADKSLLGNLQPLTPDTLEDVEDLQVVESLTIHGAHAAGIICFNFLDSEHPSKVLVPFIVGNVLSR